MPASTVLTLDTTGPQNVTLDLDTGAAFSTDLLVDAVPGTTDPDTTQYQMRFWGDVDPVANPNLGAAEGSATWVSYSTSYVVALSSGDGPKTVYTRLRDDVGNESAVVSKQITLDTTLPIPTITIDAAPKRISEVIGFNVTTLSFQTNSDIIAWKVKVVPLSSSLEGAGTVIPTTSGSVNTQGGALLAGQSREVTITGTDLKAASPSDGSKTVKVFIQDSTNRWSV